MFIYKGLGALHVHVNISGTPTNKTIELDSALTEAIKEILSSVYNQRMHPERAAESIIKMVNIFNKKGEGDEGEYTT